MVHISKLTSEDELYALAILYRDNKFECVSTTESMIEAEKIFLQLAEGGNFNAMHNYASLQF
jgi:hypothetical protein